MVRRGWLAIGATLGVRASPPPLWGGDGGGGHLAERAQTA
jgi:hypothetical protein